MTSKKNTVSTEDLFPTKTYTDMESRMMKEKDDPVVELEELRGVLAQCVELLRVVDQRMGTHPTRPMLRQVIGILETET